MTIRQGKVVLHSAEGLSPATAEYGWKALLLNVDWIKHAEAKAVGLLAGSAAAAGVLYNLVSDRRNVGAVLVGFAIASAAGCLAAAMCAVLALRPRVRLGPGARAPGLLFFEEIASGGLGRVEYAAAFGRMTADPRALGGAVADQIWATSRVAWAKYRWAARGLWCLLFALGMLGLSALLTLII